MLQEKLLGDGALSCLTEGNETIFPSYIYIYGNQVVGIQHIFFIFKELIKMKKI